MDDVYYLIVVLCVSGIYVSGMLLSCWWFRKNKSEKRPFVPPDIVTEYNRMLVDIKRHSNYKVGKYRDYIYKMKRPYGTYWCGYVDLTKEIRNQITDDQLDCLEGIVHGGLSEELIEFNCAHVTDYYSIYWGPEPPRIGRKGCTYKDHDFVLNHIKDIIDYLIDELSYHGDKNK